MTQRLWRKIAKKDKKITGLSQYMKTSGNFSVWDDNWRR